MSTVPDRTSSPHGAALPAQLSQAYLTASTSSFTDFVRMVSPESLPNARSVAGPGSTEAAGLSPHATTLVALCYDGGVLLAGDRRATSGHVIAQRDIEKVFPADEYSLIGVAGSAGLGLELTALFRLELEHYEKIEGNPLSLEGKANRLATMLRQNLGLTLQGLAVVPLFVGWDQGAERGRIFSYDPIGGRYEERDYYSIGSGSVFAQSSVKKLYRPDLSADDAVRTAIQALYDASEDDSATGWADLARRIYPVIWTAGADGADRVDEERLGAFVAEVVEGRQQRPDGPAVPIV